MISVENFYHVLYDNLLKPVNFRMRYFWPFGTTKHLMANLNPIQDGQFRGLLGPLVLFHYDQEPIYQDDIETIKDAMWMTRPHRFPRLLANSERSHLKRQVLKECDSLDWYFFYHGFAALDWYRDANYLRGDNHLSHAFISLNHHTTNLRSYRLALTARLIKHGIMDHGIVSLHTDAEHIRNEIDSDHTYLSAYSKELIERFLLTRNLPLIADRFDISGTASADFGYLDYRLRRTAAFSLVNETVFYHDKLHLTEKIFQPIVCSRPFILAGAAGNLQYLKSYGFQTFANWIDERYDEEPDPDIRMDMIVAQLERLCSLSISQLRSMLQDMQPVLDHNKKHFFGEFRRIIIDECVENFNQCIRIWNNGRLDGRELPLHPDPADVKSVLLL